MTPRSLEELRTQVTGVTEGTARVAGLLREYVTAYNNARAYEADAVQQIDSLIKYLHEYFHMASIQAATLEAANGSRVVPGTFSRYLISDDTKRVIGKVKMTINVPRADLGLEPKDKNGQAIVLAECSESIAIWKTDRWLVYVAGRTVDMTEVGCHLTVAGILHEAFKKALSQVAQTSPHE